MTNVRFGARNRVPAGLTRRQARALGLAFLLTSTLEGCASLGAPSFEFFGAFFPAWMLCALAGIAGAGIARAVLVSARLLGLVPWLLAVCTAIGTLVAISIWFLLFR